MPTCPFCGAEYTREMMDLYNTTYGCDTGCDYYRIVIKCNSCEKTIYVKGGFGEVYDEEKQTYLDEVEDAELIKAIEEKDIDEIY